MKEVEGENNVIDNMGPEVQQRFDKYTVSPDHNNVFYGDKHNRAELMSNSGSISVDRQGGMTTAILSMLIEEENGKPKYTIDQLLDTNQFQKEKQERFDEIVNRSRKTANDKDKTMAESEDGKWLVETLYKGLKRLNEIIDETAEKIDFTKDNFIYSEEFAKVAGLSSIAFDAWQEINRFGKMMHEAVQADRPELTTEESRRKLVDGMVNPLATTYQYMQKSFDYHNKAQIDDINVSSYILNALHVKYVENIMRDWKNSGTKLSQYMAENNIAHKMDQNRFAATMEMGDMSIRFATLPNIGAVADRRIQDGSLLKNVEYDDVNETFTNFPKLKNDNSDFDVEEMEIEKEAAPKKEPKTVDQIMASKGKWSPVADKIASSLMAVNKNLNMLDPNYNASTQLVLGLVGMKSDASKCIPTMKHLEEFLQKKHEGDKTFYETISEGMKPGEFYGLISELNAAFGDVIDMDNIGRLKPMDKAVYDAVKKEKMNTFKAGNEYSKMVDKYTFSLNRELRQSFLGDKYTSEQLRDDPKFKGGSISIDRTGGYSIAALHMLTMKENGKRKYSIQDVFDPKKFRDKKLELFDEVLDHSSKAGPRLQGIKNQSSRWFVDTIYESIKGTVELIDELAEKIDFNDANFDKSEEYFQINLLGNIIHDAWQEICTFPELMDEKLKKEYPQLKNKKQRYDAFQDIVGPIGDIGGEMIILDTEHNKLVNQDPDQPMQASKFLYAAIKQGPARDMFRQWHENGNGKTLTQYFRDNKLGAQYYAMNEAIGAANGSLEYNCSGSYERQKKIDNLFMNGILYKDLTYTPGKKGTAGVFNNAPTYDAEKEQVVFPEVKPEKKVIKKTEKKAAKKTEKKKSVAEAEIKSVRKSSKKNVATFENSSGENIPVDELIDYLQELKQTAGGARGVFADSDEYMEFYMAIDDVMKAARNLKKTSNNILNGDADRLKEYKEAVNNLKDCAEVYEVYKMKDHTKDKSKEPNKKALNSDDKRKLKIMSRVLHNNRYFNVDTPKLTNEEFLEKSDRALFRLKQGDYKNKKNYIQDSAYALYGQMYRVSGGDDKSVDLQQIMQEKIASGEFEKTLKSKKDPDKYIAPTEVAKKALNEDKMKEMANTVKKEVADNKNIIREVPRKGTVHQKGNDIDKRSKLG